MADKYLRNSASGSATGADWANAYTTLVAAFAGMSAGGRLFVADDHAESQTTSMTLTSPGTAASPCIVICVNTHTVEPPTGVATSATITTATNATVPISFAGFVVYYGITFNCGSGSSGSGSTITATPTTPFWLKFDACALKLLTTGSSSVIAFGNASTSVDDGSVELVNTTLTFAATGQSLHSRCPFTWRHTTSAVNGTVPTTLIIPGAGNAASMNLIGIDLSAIGTGKNILSLSIASPLEVNLEGCKLGSGVSITTGSILGQGGTSVRVTNSDSSDTNYRYYKQNYSGIISHNTATYRSGGASDGTTNVSRKMESSANAKNFCPLVMDDGVIWNETLTSQTLTVYVITDNVTLKNSEAWVEVSYLGTSGFPLLSSVDDAVFTYLLETDADQDTDTSTWTTSGITTPVKQKLSVTFAAAEKGPIYYRVCLAKASTTMYVDPLAVLS